MFRDRTEAGERLGEALVRLGPLRDALVLAIPRGGILVGAAVSRLVGCPLDVFITRKIGAPGNPELAVGAITETGFLHCNEDLVARLCSPEFLEQERRRQETEIERQRTLYRDGRSLPPLAGKSVILVDDGLATGATYLASIQALKAADVGRLIAAVPVSPPETAETIAARVDHCVILETPSGFRSVGDHYEDFRQVTDDEVVRYLAAGQGSRHSA